MKHKNQSKKRLIDGHRESESTNLGRRGFLSISSIAAVSATGFFAETVEATSTSMTEDLGYGVQSYGASGYGGVEITS